MAEKEYIERGAVLNLLAALPIQITPIGENRDMFYHDSGWNGASVAARVDMDKIPAADVAPVVHGEWIPVDEESPCDEWDCTACGQRRTFLCEMDMDDMRECYPYCPNCGAKMDGERKEATP